MENASKALLIAGAILIAILLIAIGMMVFNSASGVIDTSTKNMSQQEKTAFNKQFTVYSGVQSGTNVRELIGLINTSNSDETNARITLNVGGTGLTRTGSNTAAAHDYAITGIAAQAQYTVDIPIGANGLVETITVTPR